MQKISCFIIAKNEEKHIAKAVSSALLVADEVIVIDSGSTDATIAIAQSLGAKVVFNKWEGYLAQKQYGESLCSHDWILNIDADEELSDKLAHEIDMIAKTGIIDKYKAYNLKIVILYREENKPRIWAPYNKTIRLYNKHHASFASNQGDTTHDKVKLHTGVNEEDVASCRGDLLHRSGSSIAQLVNKANFYTSEQAHDLFVRQRSVTIFRLLFEFPLWVFKAFIVRRYFVFGVDGLIDSMIFAFSRFMRLAKLRELENNSKKSR